MSKKKLLLIASNGMLGCEIRYLLESEDRFNYSFTTLDGEGSSRALDVRSSSQVSQIISSSKPDIIINCSAYTAVDAAEKNYQDAFEVNSFALKNLAISSKENNAKLVHISTDYVFGGRAKSSRQTPFSEDSEVSPCGIYGFSKFFGEEYLRLIIPDSHLIVRTSWLHGIHGKNFLHTMLEISKTRKSIKVVNDQEGSPTYAKWLAKVILKLVNIDNLTGTVHVSGRGSTNWMEFSKEIFSQKGISDILVEPQSTKDSARDAPRPGFSVMDLTKLERLIGEEALGWKEGVRLHLKEIIDIG